MTTQDFYNFAILAAKERGYETPNVIVHTLCSSSGIKHICKLWDNNKKKHIESKLQNNPVSAIQSFKDALDFENKKYSQIEEGIEITEHSLQQVDAYYAEKQKGGENE